MGNPDDIQEDPITIPEIKAIAKSKLPEGAWNYYTTGADQEKTLARNEAIYDQCVFSLPFNGIILTKRAEFFYALASCGT